MSAQNSTSENDSSIQIFIELFEGKFEALLEGIDTVIETRLKPIRADLTILKSDSKLLSRIVKELAFEQNNLNARLRDVETHLKNAGH